MFPCLEECRSKMFPCLECQCCGSGASQCLHFREIDIVVRVVPLRIRCGGIQQGSIAVVRSLTGCATAAPPPLEEIPR